MHRLGLDRFSGLYLLALFIVVFSILAPSTFPTMTSLHIIVSTQSVAALAALALMVPFVCQQFDLSIGATAGLAGLICVQAQVMWNVGTIPSVILAVLVGTTIGFINGFIVVKLRVNSFIATLAMTSILGSMLLIVSGGSLLPQLEPGTFTSMTQASVFGFQTVVIYVIVIAIVIWWILTRTPVGRYLYAAGSNPAAARLTGIKVDRWSWITLVASGSLAAFAGVLFVSLTGPSLDFGNGFLLPAFAAVFLGSTQLKPGRVNVWGTFIAIAVLAVGAQGLQLTTGVAWVAGIFNGAALIVAVSLAVSRERRIVSGSRSARAEEDKAETEVEAVITDQGELP